MIHNTNVDKKKLFIAIIVIILILVGIVFAFQSCEPRKKTLSPEEEFAAFINANIEFTCLLLKDPFLSSRQEEAKTKLNESYLKFKLPVDDDQMMLEILKRYENDIEVINTVRTNTRACASGGAAVPYSTEQ